jgi:hypothetical protein
MKPKSDVLIVLTAGLLVAVLGLIVSRDFVRLGYYNSGLGYTLLDIGLGALVVYAVVETIVARSKTREWKPTLANHFDRLGNDLATVYLTIAPIAARFDTATMRDFEDHQKYLEWGKRDLNNTLDQFRDALPRKLKVALVDCVSGLSELIGLLTDTRKIGGAEYGRMITFRSMSLDLQEKMCLLFDEISQYAPYWKSEIFRKRLDSYRDWFQQHGSDQGRSVMVP